MERVSRFSPATKGTARRHGPATGNKFSTVRWAGQSPAIWAMNADGSNKRQITFLAVGAEYPSYSVMGNFVFYRAAKRPAILRFLLMDNLSSVPTQLTRDDTFNYASSISPDGKQVVFTRKLNHDSHREIFTINSDGSNERQLTSPSDPNAPDANAPAWVTRRRKIAFFQGLEENGMGAQRTTPDIRHLGVMNADGSHPHWADPLFCRCRRVEARPVW